MIPLPFTLLFLVQVYTPFCVSCLDNILQHLSYILWCSQVGCIYIYNCYIFLERSFDHYVVSIFVSFHSLCFKVYFINMSVATLAFFWSLFAWNIFSQPFTFCLYVSLGLRWVSCRQHIQASCFCFHSASLCLLVGAFNPFTFKVIIDKYDPVAIYFVVWGSSLYTLSVFPVQTISFSICQRAALVVLNSLSFCLSVKL